MTTYPVRCYNCGATSHHTDQCESSRPTPDHFVWDADDDAYFDRLQMWEENEAENREAEASRPGWSDR